MKQVINYFVESYHWESEYIHRKSLHAFFMLILIILSVIIETGLGILTANMSIELVIGNIIAILLFIGMIYLIKYGKLLICGNVFIFAGAMKLLQFIVIERSNQFYLQVLLGMIVGIVIYVKKYQLYGVIIMSLSFTLARIPYILYYEVNNPLVTEEYIHQMYQATTGIILFIILILFYDRIVSREIENTERLKVMAETDMLTTLKNRQMFNQKLNEMNASNHCIALMDIDYFKSINDQYGHQVGDDVLRIFSQLMKDHLSHCDLYRWGGEEFAVVSGKIPNKNFCEKLESFRKKVACHPFPIKHQVTVSIGCICTSNYNNQKNMMINVDQALYKAKETGRNKVVAI